MNEVTPILKRNFSPEYRFPIKACDLYTLLESKQEFMDWIENLIKEEGFVEEKDFDIDYLTEVPRGDKVYNLSIPTAMVISSLERSPAGKKISRELAMVIESYRRLSMSSIWYKPPMNPFFDDQYGSTMNPKFGPQPRR